MQHSRSFNLVALVIVVALTSGCNQTDPPIDNGITIPEGTCIDRDHDGYGAGCEAGLDCNDFDNTIFADCTPDAPCTVPRAGCECSNEGEQVACRTTEPVTTDDGATMCFAGQRTCEGGQWGICEGLTGYDPLDASDFMDPSPGARREAVLGHPRPCEDSCDTGCRSIYDCPSDTDYTEDAAIAPDNPDNAPGLRYDLEYTVGSGEDAVTYPPATVLDVGFTEGWFYRSFAMSCPDDMMATWWALDFDLYFPPPDGETGIEIEVRTAAFADELPDDPADPAGPPWIPVVRCPDTRADAMCTRPVNPHDREMSPDSGNLAAALGEAQSRHQFVQMRVHFWRNDAIYPSPRLGHYEVFFFCSEAS